LDIVGFALGVGSQSLFNLVELGTKNIRRKEMEKKKERN